MLCHLEPEPARERVGLSYSIPGVIVLALVI